MKIIVFTAWAILFVHIINICFSMISAASTIENILGTLGIAIIIIVSYETKCLTKFLKFRKNEK
jgi:hypothetical protein